jgi:DNA ligase D-like protein (predicted 3'-phosphoesterase)
MNKRKRFVVHEHKATRLHWDFRLELDGVLKSWAVPKRPPIKPGVRRLAIEVEDHDLNYLSFEGTIPEGQYGAGTVKIWDIGEYNIDSVNPVKIVIRMFGKKMRGRYVLVKFKGRNKNWLLIKTKTNDDSER